MNHPEYCDRCGFDLIQEVSKEYYHVYIEEWPKTAVLPTRGKDYWLCSCCKKDITDFMAA